ncbi:hypothetical protein SKTS_34170 [Sulfurimicrobium lacus]|uniref:Uncharacterized protein n=1 Tax=Sulfurimicrobium lacus TaxID=2715678 RepID=A0A6F8VH86_9PROT|nr:hypothetical protein [Sulfurimicrobium lacus]BCB28531.1 hypothetical protein SKTS_34170 [Sulfurimicrobium lacus]
MSGKHKHRTGLDRRKRDAGPPAGWKERRRNPERRMPEVEEISIEEFQRLMQASGAATPSHAESTEEEVVFDWDEVRKL